MSEKNLTEETQDNEMIFNSFIMVLWARRNLIIFGTLAATLLSIVISIVIPRIYRSEGFYQLGNPTKKIVKIENDLPINPPNNPTEKISEKERKEIPSIGIPIPIYKGISTQFFNPNRLQFIASKNKTFGEREFKSIKYKLNTPTEINKWIKPVYAFAKEDAREFVQLSQDETNRVIGLNLAYEADSPIIAHDYVFFFGDYIRDCFLYTTLYNYIMDGYSVAKAELNKNENAIINLQFEILQSTKKMQDIRNIISSYPESAKIENRQLVSIQDGGSRFLAPVTQLVGIESSLADQRLNLAELERKKEKFNLRSEYFSACYGELSKNGENGESLFLMLKSKKDEVFDSKDLGNDAVKEVLNNLSIDMQNFDFTFIKNSRFISGPTVPSVSIRPRKSFIIIFSFLGALFFFTTLAFALHWWQGNKKSILSGPTS